MARFRIDDLNYELNNPFSKRESAKSRIIKRAHLTYKSVRKRTSRFVPLSKHEQFLFDDDKFELHDGANGIPSVGDSDGVLSLDLLHFYDVFPKEHLSDVLNGLVQMSRRFRDPSFFMLRLNDLNFENLRELKFGKRGWTNLDGFGINKVGNLHKYISCVQFRLINKTESFFVIQMSVRLNKELKNQLENYLKSNVIVKPELVVSPSTRYRDFRRLGYSFGSGAALKYDNLKSVLADVIWNVSREMSRYFELLMFKSQIESPYALTLQTDVLGTMKPPTSNKSSDESDGDYYLNAGCFWSSVGVDNFRCRLMRNKSACLSVNEANMIFIYEYHTQDESPLDTNRMFAYQGLGEWYGEMTVPIFIANFVNRELFKYSQEIFTSKKTGRNLNLQVRLAAELTQPIRLLMEYSEQEEHESRWLDEYPELPNLRSPKATSSLIVGQYETYRNLFESTINARLALENHRLSKTGMFIAIASVVLASISMLLALAALYPEQATDVINTLCSSVVSQWDSAEQLICPMMAKRTLKTS